MDNLSEKQKNRYAFIVAVIFIIILLITGTVSWLIIRANSNTVNKIKAGALDLRIDESPTHDGDIHFENAIPQSYRQGIANQPYKFTIINNSTIPTNYTLTIEDLYDGIDANLTDDDKIDDSLIRYILVKNDDEMLVANSRLLSTGRTIETGTIAGKTGNEAVQIPYTLYVWIDSKAGDDGTEADIMDKIFNGRLHITAEQHHNAILPAPLTLQRNIWIEDAKKLCIKTQDGNRCFSTDDDYDHTESKLASVFGDDMCNQSTLGSATNLMYNCREEEQPGYNGCYIQSFSGNRRYLSCGLNGYSYRGMIGNLTCSINNYEENGYAYFPLESEHGYYCRFYTANSTYSFNNIDDEPYIE